MNDVLADSEERDAAWVTIDTRHDPLWLKEFLSDIVRLYRINSLLEFKELRKIGSSEYNLQAKNLSNGSNMDLKLKVTPDTDGLRVDYSKGLKTSTTFRIEAKPDGLARLVITDEYSGTTEEEREDRIAEVDKSLIAWGQGIHRYLRQWKRWSAVPGWKWYMRRVWQPMKPSARRISFMLFMITAIEFVAFLIIFAIFGLEMDKYLA